QSAAGNLVHDEQARRARMAAQRQASQTQNAGTAPAENLQHARALLQSGRPVPALARPLSCRSGKEDVAQASSQASGTAPAWLRASRFGSSIGHAPAGRS